MSSRSGGAQRLDTFTARRVHAALQTVEPTIRNASSETVYVYDRYSNHVGTYHGTSDTTALPTADARTFAGGTLTHNHPQGGSFSPSDVAFAQKAQLAEMRAVGRAYTYSLRPPRGGWNHVDTTWFDDPAAHLRSLQQMYASRLRQEHYGGQRTMTQDAFNLEVTHRAMLDLARDTGMIYRRTRAKA